MTSPIDRAAEAPRILGVSMEREDDGEWVGAFGSLQFGIWPAGDVFDARVSECCILLAGTLPDCIAAIERELLAIRDAIPVPTRAAEPPQPASVGGVENERIRRFALCNHDILLRDCPVCREPPHLSNEEDPCPNCGRSRGALVPRLRARIDELERRLTKGGA